MADWRMTGIYFKSCNCDPGCPCDFMSPPTHHTCEGVVGMQVEQGHFDHVSLDGVKWAIAFHWPGPLHEGNGTVKPYFDPSATPEQLNALGQILTGQAAGTWFTVLASIISEVKQPAIVPIAFEVSQEGSDHAWRRHRESLRADPESGHRGGGADPGAHSRRDGVLGSRRGRHPALRAAAVE
jgi:hypothetical protein